MSKLSRYILAQIAGPLMLFTLLVTLVIWLTQSLRLLDLVINRGQSAGMFAYLSVLMLPSLATIVVPIAFFAGALYALNRLNNDSELVVMWASGFSRAQIAVPLLAAAGIAMAITYACNLYLAPFGQRTMKDKEFDIRTDIGASILREGTFTTPSDGLTVFIRAMGSDGRIHGLLVHDSRNPKIPVTYLAQNGVMAQTDQGARLIMFNGEIEQGEQNGARLSVLKFDQYSLDLDKYASPQRTSLRDASERYLSELFHPATEAGIQRRRRLVFLAEAHNRLSAPLYCIAFALMALLATCQAHMARGNYTLRLMGFSVAAIALRLLGYAAQGLAADQPLYNVALYAIPLGTTGLAVLGLSGAVRWPVLYRHRSDEMEPVR